MHLLGHETSPPLDRASAPGLVWFLTAAAFPKTFQPVSETPDDNDAHEQKMMQRFRAHHPERPTSATPPTDSRNEPPSTPSSSPGGRRKPLPGLELRNEAGSGSSTRDRRTVPRTDADRTAPDGPIGRPQATPRAPLDGPKTP